MLQARQVAHHALGGAEHGPRVPARHLPYPLLQRGRGDVLCEEGLQPEGLADAGVDLIQEAGDGHVGDVDLPVVFDEVVHLLLEREVVRVWGHGPAEAWALPAAGRLHVAREVRASGSVGVDYVVCLQRGPLPVEGADHEEARARLHDVLLYSGLGEQVYLGLAHGAAGEGPDIVAYGVHEVPLLRRPVEGFVEGVACEGELLNALPGRGAQLPTYAAPGHGRELPPQGGSALRLGVPILQETYSLPLYEGLHQAENVFVHFLHHAPVNWLLVLS